jgi:type II secretory pathway pseudopilin PulG
MGVIVIIGILIMILYPSVNRYLMHGRDANRTVALTTIKKAITLYQSENGTYPPLESSPYTGCVPSSLSPKYINTIPTSPS